MKRLANILEKAENIANFKGKKAPPFKKDEAENTKQALQAIGNKLVPIIKELDKLESAHGDASWVGFIKGTANKLHDIHTAITKFN